MKAGKVICLFALLLPCAALAATANKLSEDDVANIRQVHKRYEETWLKGDADGVRSLFTEDCVLLPPHSDTPRIGQKGLNEFWFPPNAPPTQVTQLVVTLQGIAGDGQVAYVWGTDEVAWTTVQDNKTVSASHKGTFLNVLEKQPNGKWKISRHMWDDQVARH